MNIDRAKEVLDYWIPEDGSPDYNKWFMKSEEYDEEIKEKFGNLLKEAEQGKGFGWLHTKESFVAYIILLDQFSRHIYRGSGEAFKNDIGVMIFTELGFELYKDKLVGYEFMFAFMPYMHTENLKLQKKGYEIFQNHINLYKINPCLTNERKITDPSKTPYTTRIDVTQYDKEYQMLKSMESHVEGHIQTISNYGRFPKRNQSLGRESTKQEIIYLNQPEVQKRPY